MPETMQLLWLVVVLVHADAVLIESVNATPDDHAALGEFPGAVSLQYLNGTHFCGGTIVDVNHIVTAAACLFSSADGEQIDSNSIQVIGGDLIMAGGVPSKMAQIRKVQQLYVHPEYDASKFANDIGVVRVFPSFVEKRPFLYPVAAELIGRPPDGTECNVPGWGANPEKGLNAKTVVIATDTVCTEWKEYNELLNPKMICVDTTEDETEPCLFDKGSGLICQDKLAGVATVNECGTLQRPEVYASVGLHAQFILDCIDGTTITAAPSVEDDRTVADSPTAFGHRNAYNTMTMIGLAEGVVSLQYKKDGKHICSGMIIDRQHVLTAAECLAPKNQMIDFKLIHVIGGELHIIHNGTEAFEVRGVEHIFVHTQYNASSLANNIGVVRVFPLFSETQPFYPLNPCKETPAPGSKCTASGWGAFREGELNEKAAIVATESVCQLSNDYYKLVGPKLICVDILVDDDVACQFDLGTGLICNGQLAGIASVNVCHSLFKHQPVMYADVGQYAEFITSAVGWRNASESASAATNTKDSVSRIVYFIVLYCVCAKIMFYNV